MAIFNNAWIDCLVITYDVLIVETRKDPTYGNHLSPMESYN